MRQRVDDDDLVTGRRRCCEGLAQGGRLERLKVELVERELVGVLRRAAALGVDDGDPLAEAGGDGERGIGLASPGRPGEGDAGLGLLLRRAGEGEFHSSQSSRTSLWVGASSIGVMDSMRTPDSTRVVSSLRSVYAAPR